MRIVQIQTQAEAAGAQAVSDLLGRELRARGHDVRTVFLYRKTDAFDGDPFSDYLRKTIPSNGLDRVAAAAALVPYLFHYRPDAVVTYQHYGNIVGAAAARLIGCRTVIANQNGTPSKVGTPLLNLLDKLFGTVGIYSYNVANSHWTASQFDRHPSAYRNRMVLVPHGVERPLEVATKSDARLEFQLPQSGRLIVSVGRLVRLKNQQALIPVLKELPADTSLAIAGIGDAAPRLRKQAAELGLAGRLHLVGEVPHEKLHRFLAAADVFVFPSMSETFGLAVVEAALAGLPIVCSDLPVLREVLQSSAMDGVAFVDFADARASALEVERLLQQRRSTTQLHSELTKRYSPAAMAQAYEALLERERSL